MPFFSSISKNHTELIIDIGSSSVGLAFVQYAHDASPRMLFVTRKEVLFDESMDATHILEKTANLLDIALREATTGAHFTHPDRVTISLAAPWYASQVRSVRYADNGKKFRVIKSLAEGLVQTEYKAFLKDLQASPFFDALNAEIITNTLIDSKINGYTVADPLRLQGTSCAFDVYFAVASSDANKRFRALVKEYFPRNHKIQFTAFGFASWLAFRKLFPHTDEYLFLDIGGEITDAMVVRGAVPVSGGSFPYGKHTMLRAFAQATHSEGEHALSLCNLYQTKMLDEKERVVIDEVLQSTRKEWHTKLETAIETIETGLLPYKVFVTIDADCAPWFLEMLRNQALRQFVDTSQQFEVTLIDANVMQSYVTIEAQASPDPFLILLAIANNAI